MPHQPVLQVYILSYERPNFLRQSLLSVLQQNIQKSRIEIIVSDNSRTDNVSDMMRNEFAHIKLFRRIPSLSAHDHFRVIKSEITSKYTTLFHDDDIMHPDYCKVVLDILESDPDVSAVATNAFSIDINGDCFGLFNGIKSKISFSDKPTLLSNYVPGRSQAAGVAPFPSYCYRKESLNIPEVPIAGKYTDVVVIGNALDFGKIIWLPAPLIYYRLHGQNDSFKIDINAFLKLCRYMTNNGVTRVDPFFRYWRRMVWFRWYLQQKNIYQINFFFLQRLPVPTSWKELQVHRACVTLPYRRVNSVFQTIIRFSWVIIGSFSMRLGYCVYLFRLFRAQRATSRR